MNSITAIIPTLTNTKGLNHLLTELAAARIPSIVIDNGSKLTSEVKMPSAAWPKTSEVRFLNPPKNLFFAAAVNLGAKIAQSDWLLICNDDIELTEPKRINDLLKFAEDHKLIAVSPILNSPKGTIENIGYTVLPIGRVLLNFDPTHNTDKYLDGLTAACLLIRRDVFIKIGMFDESFIAYLEDVDLFLRLKKAGFHFGVDTQVEVIHNHLTTSKTMKGFKQQRDLINWIKIIQKNWNANNLRKYFPQIVLERIKNISGWCRSLKF